MFALSLQLAGCGGLVGGLDASTDGAGADGSADEPWSCGDPTAKPTPTGGDYCDDAGRAACQAWAQSLVHHGVAYSQCAVSQAGAGLNPLCRAGDKCQQLADGFVMCACGGLGYECGLGQVCVTDTASSSPHCVTACFE